MKIAFEPRDIKLWIFLIASVSFVYLTGFNQRTVDVAQYDESGFELVNVNLDCKTTKIELYIPNTSMFKLYPPGSANAYFLLDINTGKRYPLLAAENIRYNEWTSGSQTFTLIFPRLDENVSEFHLIEGTNQVQMQGRAVNFFNIQL